ncbi:MAG: restriction endonuclease subunit S [bacterium]
MNYVTLGKIAEFINGYAFKPSDWSNEGLSIIRIQNLTDSNKPFNKTTKSVPDKYIVHKGDLLISWSATLGIFEWEKEEDALLNQHIFKVLLDSTLVEKRYFMYVLQHTIAKMSQFTHGSTMKHIVRGDFLKHQIPLPDLDKQKLIVELLDKANALRQKRNLSIHLLDQYLKSAYLEMFGNPMNNPKNWGLKKFGAIGKLDRGMSKHRPRNAPELLGGDHPLIQTGDVSNSGIYIRTYKSTYSDIGLKQSKKWPKGTLCITIAANIAKTGILDFDACFPDSVVGFVPDLNQTNNLFIHFWISFLQEMLERNAPVSAQKNINLKILRELDVFIPPIESQNKFADIVNQTESLKFKMIQQLEVLDTQFQSLMQRSFSVK